MNYSFLLIIGLFIIPLQGLAKVHQIDRTMPSDTSLRIPAFIKKEHDELHQRLVKATKLPGKTGQAAKRVADLMHPHFIKEEEMALPLLSLLPFIAEGKTPQDPKSIIKLTDKLKSEFPQMLAEHKKIVTALNELSQAAKSENHPEVVQFANDLIAHAKTEEEVLYPSVILIGECLKLK